MADIWIVIWLTLVVLVKAESSSCGEFCLEKDLSLLMRSMRMKKAHPDDLVNNNVHLEPLESEPIYSGGHDGWAVFLLEALKDMSATHAKSSKMAVMVGFMGFGFALLLAFGLWCMSHGSTTQGGAKQLQPSQPPLACAKGLLHASVYTIWAALVGMSVPLGMVIAIFLNSQANESDQKFHAFYVATLAVAIGGAQLAPLAVKTEKVATLPKRWWHFAGGLCSMPRFFVIFAGYRLGSQVVLLVNLAALLTTFFFIDLVGGRVRLTNYLRIFALLIVLTGVAFQNPVQSISVSGSMEKILLLILVALGGIGFALQSKCNNALAEALGSAARASLVSACVHVLTSVPIALYIFFSWNVSFSCNARYWYLWLLAGFQSAFYIGSMAHLPSVLGFTRCYIVTLVAQMVTSLMVDAHGLIGKAIPVSANRVYSLLIVLIGAGLFHLHNNSEDEPGMRVDQDTRESDTHSTA